MVVAACVLTLTDDRGSSVRSEGVKDILRRHYHDRVLGAHRNDDDTHVQDDDELDGRRNVALQVCWNLGRARFRDENQPYRPSDAELANVSLVRSRPATVRHHVPERFAHRRRKGDRGLHTKKRDQRNRPRALNECS